MRVYELLNEGSADGAKPFEPRECAAPLPRAYQWADGSAYVTHVELVRKGARRGDAAVLLDRSADVPGRLRRFHRSLRPIVAADEAWGIDFEAEIAVITDDVPMGVTAAAAESHIKLLMLVNDVSCAISSRRNSPRVSASSSRSPRPPFRPSR